MKLTEEIKAEIYREYNAFRDELYAGKSLEERKELDQFFTPPELTIQMLEKFDYTLEELKDKKILDPTCGSGNLLVACLIAGADYKNLYGNDYDERMVIICRDRLRDECEKLGMDKYSHWDRNIHCGNALQRKCITDFGDGYSNYRNAIKAHPELKDDLRFAQKDYELPESKPKYHYPEPCFNIQGDN